MANMYNQGNRFGTEDTEYSIHEILLPDGYELAHYTLRRVYDGHLQSYSPLGASVPPMQTPVQPAISTNQSSTLVLPIRSNNANRTHITGKLERCSETTKKRHAHARSDDYTDVCGVISPEKADPVKRSNPGKGNYYFPRCGSNFTRPKSVKDHFPDCVAKCGNPDALRYTDHPSMAQHEAAIQRRRQGSRETSSMDTEDEMNDTPASTPIQGVHDGVTGHDGQLIKSEFVFGADVAYESIEAQQSEYRSRSISRDDPRIFVKPFSGSQTPEWQTAKSPRSTPTPHVNRWNIGIPGSAAEHDIADMRATIPFEGWPVGIDTSPTEPPTRLSQPQSSRSSGSQTPKPTHPEGLQDDGLDSFMDRRSYFSPTPAAWYPSSTTEDLDEDDKMEG